MRTSSDGKHCRVEPHVAIAPKHGHQAFSHRDFDQRVMAGSGPGDEGWLLAGGWMGGWGVDGALDGRAGCRRRRIRRSAASHQKITSASDQKL